MIAFDGLVAQLVEQCPFKALVPGSSPGQPTSLRSERKRRAKTAAPKLEERRRASTDLTDALRATTRQASKNEILLRLHSSE